MSVGSDSSRCGGNTDGPTEAIFLKPPPFVQVPALFAYGCLLPIAAKQAHWRTAKSRVDDQVRSITVAKVF